MSSCLKNNDPDKSKNDALNNNLKKAKNSMDTAVKVLLLGFFFKKILNFLSGAGESGKSTFFKQMKIIYVNGYTQDELLAIRETVRENIMKSMKSLLSAANQRGFEFFY
jgi:guanine nucleotide-binding protein G(i) subunit alpha